MPEKDGDPLVHYGIKGMRWGVRKSKEEGQRNRTGVDKTSRFTPEQKAKAKKVAIGVGILAVAAGTIYVGYVLNKNGSLPLSKLSKPTVDVGKKAVEKVLSEPTSVVHATRGKHVGFQFVKSGGLKDALVEYDQAGFTQDTTTEFISRYGKPGAEKVAARFFDPLGRKDEVGRAIPHEVIIPHSMADGVSTLKDVVDKVWPTIKDDYDQLYPKPKSTYNN